MILHSDIETMPREDLEALQLTRLKATVERCYHTVSFYREAMDEIGFKPHHLKSLTDLHHLPYTKKEHLRDSYHRQAHRSRLYQARHQNLVAAHGTFSGCRRPQSR